MDPCETRQSSPVKHRFLQKIQACLGTNLNQLQQLMQLGYERLKQIRQKNIRRIMEQRHEYWLQQSDLKRKKIPRKNMKMKWRTCQQILSQKAPLQETPPTGRKFVSQRLYQKIQKQQRERSNKKNSPEDYMFDFEQKFQQTFKKFKNKDQKNIKRNIDNELDLALRFLQKK